MSENAIEFVETWVDEKIEAMNEAPADVAAVAKTLATQCVAEAQNDGVTQADIDDTFDDLAAFIAAEIEEAFDRAERSDDDVKFVEEDDDRLVNGEDDEEDEDDEDDKKDA
jgi:hypothetical protein